VFPAHAGVLRSDRAARGAVHRVPRARGGAPERDPEWVQLRACSPRTRGCSARHDLEPDENRVFPAHAGVLRRHRLITPHSDKCSPRTRGCSGQDGSRKQGGRVFPAHAGVLRRFARQIRHCWSVPRARGGAPVAMVITAGHVDVFPAHAGVLRSVTPRGWSQTWCSPRTRGCSASRLYLVEIHPCSPRTRGCSGRLRFARRIGRVFPAHAGVLRGTGKRRLRGASCSPRTRGCSVRDPARSRFGVGVPRARGGAPTCALTMKRKPLCSPRTRGCSAYRSR